MTPRLPTLSASEMQRVLEKDGFCVVSQKGSHRKLRNADGRPVILPMHAELAPGTLMSILRQAGMSRLRFEALLQGEE